MSSFSRVGSFKSHKIIAKEVKRGQLIEVKRNNYSHWLLCESIDSKDRVWCFHVSQLKGSSSFSGRPSEDVIIKYQTLEDIVSDTEDGKPSLCRVNDQEEKALQILKGRNSPNLDKVFAELHQNKGSKVKYDLKELNCEHYCTEWKYGVGWSSQIEDVQEATDCLLIGGTCAVAAVGFGLVINTLRKNK